MLIEDGVALVALHLPTAVVVHVASLGPRGLCDIVLVGEHSPLIINVGTLIRNVGTLVQRPFPQIRIAALARGCPVKTTHHRHTLWPVLLRHDVVAWNEQIRIITCRQGRVSPCVAIHLQMRSYPRPQSRICECLFLHFGTGVNACKMYI